METIKSAAIKFPSNVITGSSHSVAWEEVRFIGKEGFVTNMGEFVTRIQAMNIAVRNGQVKREACMDRKELHSCDLK